jgi:DoxX-like family
LSAAPEQGFIMSNLVATDAASVSAARWPVWTGGALSGLVILFLLMDASMKIAALTIVSESAVMIGWTGDPGFWRAMGLSLLAITALYAWPRTAVLGAILLTGYLGGAVATHLRMSDPLFSHTLFGVYLGIALWGGLWLRDARIRNLLPIS